MPAHIPAGREHLWQRQAEADAYVDECHEAFNDAEKHTKAAFARWTRTGDDADEERFNELAEEEERRHDELCRSIAVADRVYQERLAGLSSWIDHDPTAPICPDCKGTGGPPEHDAHGACRTCRGWGREYREPIPVWHDAHDGRPEGWYNPATGHQVDLLADPEPAPGQCPPGCSVLTHGHGTGNRLYDGEYPDDPPKDPPGNDGAAAGGADDWPCGGPDCDRRFSTQDAKLQHIVDDHKIPVYHCDDPGCDCEKPPRVWTTIGRRLTGKDPDPPRIARSPTNTPSPAGAGTGGGTSMGQQEVVDALNQLKQALEGARDQAQATSSGLEQLEGQAQQILDNNGEGADAIGGAVSQAKEGAETAVQMAQAAADACDAAIAKASAV